MLIVQGDFKSQKWHEYSHLYPAIPIRSNFGEISERHDFRESRPRGFIRPSNDSNIRAVRVRYAA